MTEEMHVAVAEATQGADAKLKKAAPKLTAAAPKTSNAVLVLFKTIFLPMLTPVLGSLIAKYGSETLEQFLIPARDILNAAYPVVEDE